VDDNPGRQLLTDGSEVLFRQVYPSWLEDDGQPSSQAFYPWRPEDEGKLSTDRSGKTTLEASFALAIGDPPQGFGIRSCGIWGMSVAEVTEYALIPREDPVPATPEKPANPAHALVDFTPHPPKKWKPIGRKLKVCAITRKRLYPSDSPPADGPDVDPILASGEKQVDRSRDRASNGT
jgi:hypothetical protein